MHWKWELAAANLGMELDSLGLEEAGDQINMSQLDEFEERRRGGSSTRHSSHVPRGPWAQGASELLSIFGLVDKDPPQNSV